MSNKVQIVILAGGEGKRMKSDLPKALVDVAGKPMLERLLASVKKATDTKPILVVGHDKEKIKEKFGDAFIYTTQDEQLGTGHALLQAQKECADTERIAVFYGDHPFVSSQTISALIEKSAQNNAEITLATTVVPNFEEKYKVFLNFARVLRDKNKKIISIREYKDANEEEKDIKEVNPGYYIFKSDWLWPHLEKIKNNNAQKEYYLTDLLQMASEEQLTIESIQIGPREAIGVNTTEELEILEKLSV